MYVKVHKSYRTVVAVCDEELVGMVFEEGKKLLDIPERFYKGEVKNPQEVEELMRDFIREDATFNIVGEKSVKAALEAGVIGKDGIGRVKDIPFALILL